MTATTAGLDAATARLQAVTRARAAGATWAQVGARQGVDGKAAKRGFRRLERDTQRAFLLAMQAGTLAPEA